MSQHSEMMPQDTKQYRKPYKNQWLLKICWSVLEASWRQNGLSRGVLEAVFTLPYTIHLHLHLHLHLTPYTQPTQPSSSRPPSLGGEWFLMWLFRVFRGVPDGIRAYKTKSDPGGRARFSSFTIFGFRCSFFL